ncbi:MAG: DNA repair protein RadC [Verrucomicrobiales bacterium]|nr:DNA repair protein RadC [Verrucomicrobiales bacterium]
MPHSLPSSLPPSPLLMRETPPHERPRERLAALGPENLKESELIAILLRSGTRSHPVTALAEQLLQSYDHSLTRLSSASLDDLRQTPGIGIDKASALKAAFELARRMARETRGETPLLDTPDRVADLLREEMRTLEVETFHLLMVNTRRRLISAERISQGTLDTLLVHPREVFRKAIAANASAIIVAHNHPSGDPTPSEADIRVTRDLIRAGQLLKIEVLDHVILGERTRDRPKDYLSLRELGYFYG